MIVVFGSINLDLTFAVPRIPVAGETVLAPSTRVEPGGKGANQALAAARAGAAVVMAGAVGNDPLAGAALRLLREAEVNLVRVRTVSPRTGCAAISVDPAGNNAISVGSGANLAAEASQVEDALLGPKATLVVQMEVPAAETAALILRAKERGARVVLNLAPAAALPPEALRAVDVLVVNEAESAWLARHLDCVATAADLRDRLGDAAVVLTRGAGGAEVAARQGSWHQAAVRVNAIDTTAAGDCFVGVLAHRLDIGQTLPASVKQATIAAGLCCTRGGSQDSLPTQADIAAFTPAFSA